MLFRSSRRHVHEDVSTTSNLKNNASPSKTVWRKTLSPFALRRTTTEPSTDFTCIEDSSVLSCSSSNEEESLSLQTSVSPDSRKRRFPKLRLVPRSSRNVATIEDDGKHQVAATPSSTRSSNSKGSLSRRFLNLSRRRGLMGSPEAPTIAAPSSSPSPSSPPLPARPQLSRAHGQRRLVAVVNHDKTKPTAATAQSSSTSATATTTTTTTVGGGVSRRDDATMRPMSVNQTAPLRTRPLKDCPALLTRPRHQFRPTWIELPRTAVEDGCTLDDISGSPPRELGQKPYLSKKKDDVDDDKPPSRSSKNNNKHRHPTPQLGSSWFPSNHVRVNLLRDKCDLRRLYRNRQLDAIARVHAEQMMIRGDTFEVDKALLKETMDESFGNGHFLVRYVGENNFVGPSLSEIDTEMMQDVTQTKNLFCEDYTHMGMGTARARNGTVYLCQLFVGY